MDELRRLWSSPVTRKKLRERLSDAGFGRDELYQLQKLVNAENSDIFDVLEYVAYSVPPIPRDERVALAPRLYSAVSNPSRENSSTLCWLTTSRKV